MDTPVDVVQRQLDAYNDRDLERFVVNFSDTFRAYRMPSQEAAISGKAALAEFYATQRFNRAGLRAELLNRIVLGNKVIDHERISGLGEHPLETVAIFEVVGELIQTAWFFSAA